MSAAGRLGRLLAGAAVLALLVVAPATLAAGTKPAPSTSALPAALDQSFTQAALAVSFSHSCAIPAGDGRVVCWGLNTFGQLGDGTVDDSDVPVPVVTAGGEPLANVTTVTVGFSHSCAVLADGTARCWGDNAVQEDPFGIPSRGGQLGDGSTDSSPSPVTVLGSSGAPLSGVVAIDAGYFRTCALLADGTVACWGDGQLTATPVTTATGDALGGVSAISTADFHSCALLADTTVRCWGRNASSELGDATTEASETAVVVGVGEAGVLTGVVAIAAGGGFTQDAGGGHTCALLVDTTVRCWGNNDFAQIGIDVPLEQFVPVVVPSAVVGVAGAEVLSEVVAISAGGGHTCALLSDSSVACWGDLNRFPILVPSAFGSQTPLTGVNGIVTDDRTCGPIADGTVLCWYVGAEANPLPLAGVVLVEPSAEPTITPQPSLDPSVEPSGVEPSPAVATAGPTATGGPGAGGSSSGGEAGGGVRPATAAVRFREAVPTPAEVTLDPVILAQTLILAAAIMLFVPFPGVLFNNTLEANYPEIVGRAERVKRRLRGFLPFAPAVPPRVEGTGKGASRSARPPFWSTLPGVVMFVLLSALLASFLDPTFGPDIDSLGTYAGLVAGFGVTLAAVCVPAILAFQRRAIPFVIRALPGTIVVGVACVLISRLTAFQPGYLYGMVIGIAARELTVDLPPRTVAISMACALAASVVAWSGLLLMPAQPDPGLAMAALQTTLATTVVAGLEGVAIGLLPIRFLAGETVFRWSRRWWAVLFTTAVAGFLLILVNPSSGYLASESQTPLATIVALLAFFSGVSVAFWAYFRFRKVAPVPSEAA